MRNLMKIRWLVVACLVVLPAGTVVSQEVAPVGAGVSEEPQIVAVDGFSWIVAGRLAAMAQPGRKRALEEDCDFMREAGLGVLVSLTEQPVPPETLAKFGLEGLHLPVEDFTPPTLAQIDRFLLEVARAEEEGWALGIHCTAGKGRTGTMLAAYLVSRGRTAAAAIAEIRRLRPGSVETRAQEERIAEFARLWSQAE